MKLHEYLKQFEGLDSELEVGLFENGDLFQSNITVRIAQVQLVRPNTYVKAFTTNGDTKNVIIIGE